MIGTIPGGKVVDKAKFFRLIGYKPHPRQVEFHKSMARFKVAACGRRAGKTYMTAKDIEPLLMVPDKRIWLVAPTYILGEKEFRVIWNDMIVKLEFGKDPLIKKSYSLRQGEMFINFPWGTSIEVRSADRKDSLVGDGLDLIVMCETAKHQRETWDRMLEPAISDKRGSAIFTSTPEGQNFFYELWQLGLDGGEEDYQSWQYPTWENTVIFPGGFQDPEIQRMRRNMSTEAFLQEIAADFTSFTGKIYKEFLERIHVSNHVYNPEWPNFMCIDFGFVNPFAAIEFQLAPDDTIHVWREHYEKGLTLEEHMQIMRNRDQPKGYKIEMAFADAADPEGIETLTRYFCPCVGDPKSKDNWRQGIDLVKRFLKIRKTKKPGLYVDPSCRNLIREFNNYKAVPGVKDSDPREMAKKSEDHALDALRYGLMHIFELGYRSRLSDLISPGELKEGIGDSGLFTNNEYLERYPTLASSGFVSLDGQTF